MVAVRRSCRLQIALESTSLPDTQPHAPGKRKRVNPVLPLTAKVDSTLVVKCAEALSLPRERELAYNKRGFNVVIGVDEAGRGPLAGPVVAAACHIPMSVSIPGIKDSKQVAEVERERLYEVLTTTKGVRWAVHVVDNRRIDEINILQATLEAMRESIHLVHAMNKKKDKAVALVDGNKLPEGLALEAECIIGGDSLEYSISAASIIAKVTRDRMMIEWDKRWPEYGFLRHKGYGTAAHMAAIAEHGPCEIHRMSFRPLRKD